MEQLSDVPPGVRQIVVAVEASLEDMIIRGGFNVYPRELEEVLLTHPR